MKFLKRNGPKKPAFWKTYESHFAEQWASKTRIVDLDFFVVDTETTGLDTRKDKLLSIAGLTMRRQTIYISESFDCFLPALGMQRTDAIPIHGIVPGNKIEQMELEPAMIQFLSMLKNKILVGHHILFDIKMINRTLASLGAGKLRNQYLDTAILAQRLETIKNLQLNQGISLDALCDYYDLKMYERHTAAGDAFLTSQIFCRQLREFESKGQNKLENLLQTPIKRYPY